jgi:hypothetical protein
VSDIEQQTAADAERDSPPLVPAGSGQRDEGWLAELRELAVRLALGGYTLADAAGLLERRQNAEVGAVKAHFQRLRLRLEARRSETDVQLAARRALAAEQEALAADESGARDEVRMLEQRKLRLEAQLAQRRRAAAANRLVTTAKDYAASVQASADLLLRSRFSAALNRFMLEREADEINRPELERSKSILAGELDRLDAPLTEAAERVSALRRLGITKTISGFLIWVAYIAFAAIGLAISYLLQSRMPEAGDDPSRVFASLAAILLESFATTRPLLRLVYSTFAIAAAALGFCAFVFAVDRLIQLFDRSWRPRQARGRGRQRHTTSPIPSPSIDRSAFTQLLAAIPYAALAAVIFLVFAADSATVRSGTAQLSPAAGWATTYVGTVYALLATAAGIVYVIYIVLPRSRHVPPVEAPVSRAGALLKSHWEMAAVLALLLAGPVVVALAPSAPEASDLAWGVLAIAMTACCLALAHGVVYHGQFVDLDRLERDRARLRVEIEGLDKRPLLELDDFLDHRGLNEDLRVLARDQRDAAQLEGWAHLVAGAYEGGEPGEYFLRLWQRLRAPRWRLRLRRVGASPTALPFDFAAAPEESGELLTTIGELSESQVRLESLKAALAKARAAAEEIPSLSASLAALEVQLRALEQEETESVLRCEHRHLGEKLEFRAAFGLGERVEPILRPSEVANPAANAQSTN